MPRKNFKQDTIDRMKQYFLQNDRMWKIMLIAIFTLRSIYYETFLTFHNSI